MTKEHWIENSERTSSDYSLSLIDPEGWWEATVKLDGCVDLVRYFNKPKSQQEGKMDCNYIHICDIDGLIEKLTDMRDKAKHYFNDPNWG